MSMRLRYSIPSGVVALLVTAELAARMLGYVDFPVYALDRDVGYLPKPDQSGRFMLTNDWYFNNESMPVPDAFAPGGATDVLLVGNSIVMGGNPYSQSEKLTVQLQSRLGRQTKVWPAAVGGWSQVNEIAYLTARPEVVAAADYIAWEYTPGGLSGASAWRGEYVFPTHRPLLASWYVLRKYLVPRFAPMIVDDELPPTGAAEEANRAAFERLLRGLARARAHPPGFLWFYPSQAQLLAARRGEEWIPERAMIEELARRCGLRIVDIAARSEWRSDLYRDGVHPSVEGNRILGAILAAEISDDLAHRTAAVP
jgi:hypothetical protein